MAAEVFDKRAATVEVAALFGFGHFVLQCSSSFQPADKADTNTAKQNSTPGMPVLRLAH